MSLTPLLEAPPPVLIHALAALAAFALGLIQFAGRKGALPHRIVGYAWTLLMGVVAISSFWIQSFDVWRGWSPIHLLSILTLLALPLAILAARRRAVRSHRRGMTTLYLGALVVAGLFAFAPGRVLNAVLLGG